MSLTKPSLQRITDILFYLSIIIFFTALNFGDNLPPGWNQQFPPVGSRNITDVQFLDTLNGWAVTNGGTSGTDTALILKTTNGGENWQRQYKHTMTSTLLSIKMLNASTGYAAGGAAGNGLVLKTTNGGLNWLDLNFTTGIVYVDMSFINADTGWICDDVFGGLWRTTDGGSSWQIQATVDINNIFFVNSSTGWFTRPNYQVYKTTNGGSTWNLQYIFSGTIYDIYFVNANTGWVTRLDTIGVYKSTNGGTNWNPVNYPVGYTGVLNLFFINDSTGWAGGSYHKINLTKNGVTWGKQTAPTNTNYTPYFVDSLHGWACNYALIHTTDGGGEIIYNGIGNQQNIADKFILCQNYPNPFNPSTIINYELRVTGYVKLTVYDITGREIKILVNKKQSPGKYKTEFSGMGLSSGVYFYRITVSSHEGKEVYTQTKKMLMIK